ncbi:MAG: homocysteine methyltransferase [Gammaproteobacteria bacterium]|nr:homocysteine methyltransferase [Gammaproteobacteria bacterium]
MNVQTAQYRNNLPQLGSKMFVADGGLETSMIFQRDIDLPLFAAFPLIASDEGISQLESYFTPYIDIAIANKAGIILDTPTWRCSQGWSEQLGYSTLDTQFFNEASVDFLLRLRNRYQNAESPIVINGAIGPQGDGYSPTNMMTKEAAEEYHSHQVKTFAITRADMITAVTMPYVEEAIGIAHAAARAGIPAAISFTVETDGRLPSGMSLQQAIELTDAETGASPAYYMINCAHPSHFEQVLNGDEAWMQRIYGVRANASCMSHAELDEATELDDGNPREFGEDYRKLRQQLQNLRVVGGCCGTDHRHIAEICRSMDFSDSDLERQVA